MSLTKEKFSGVSLVRHTSILAICTAYESGFGHGLKRDQLVNPYEKFSNDWIAYGIGYEAGSKRPSSEPGAAQRCDYVGMYDGQCGLDLGHAGEHRLFGPHRGAVKSNLSPLQAETRAATSRGCSSTEDAGRPEPSCGCDVEDPYVCSKAKPQEHEPCYCQCHKL